MRQREMGDGPNDGLSDDLRRLCVGDRVRVKAAGDGGVWRTGCVTDIMGKGDESKLTSKGDEMTVSDVCLAHVLCRETCL